MTARPPGDSRTRTACRPSVEGADDGTDAAGPDDESRAWVRRLRPHHPDRATAVAELHALLLRAARFEIHRRSAAAPHLRGGDHADLADQSADDALVAVLAKLDDYRGASRFTTWVYKFALLEAAVTMRRLAWQGREIPTTPERWPTVVDPAVTTQHDLETREVLAAVGAAVDRSLSHHQREVLLALTVDDVPIDVLSQRLGTTRGAIYKTLHDARRKLRATLAADGTLPVRAPDGGTSG
jgi:RNA polymerase sigma-70 factor (ECF subfamily)